MQTAMRSLGAVTSQAIKWIRRHPRIVLGVAFGVAWALASWVFYVRYPNNFTQPNFYAEDGRIFLTNILDQGPLRALFNPFNGYFIVGIYLIGDIAVLLNGVLFGGEFIQLPQAIALASYGFLGLCAALPIITLNKLLRPAYLALLVLGLMFVPMPLNDYVVIGTLGNLKFAFGFIAILLIAKRWTLKRDSKLIPLLDAGVLLCAYTTATVYLMLPFYLLCDGLRPRQLWEWRKTWRPGNIALWSAVALGALALIQLGYVATHGIPKLPGYLDSPFQYSKAIEIFLGRSVLYIFAGPYYHLLTDAWVITGVAALGLVVGWAARRWNLALAGLAVSSAIMASVLFLMNRPGLSEMFAHYGWAGPDQFFYAQTMMMMLAACVTLQAIADHVRWRGIQAAMVTLAGALIILGAPKVSSYGNDHSMENARGTIYATARTACKQPGNELHIDVYPTAPWQITASRAEVCTPALAAHKAYRTADMGLVVHANNPVNVAAQKLRQPVTVADPHWAGLNVFISTYAHKVSSPYELVIYGADCSSVITKAAIRTSELKDNSLAAVRFRPVSEPGNYCFSVQPVGAARQPLALQLSSENPGMAPLSQVDGKTAAQPVTYSLIYEEQ